MKFLTAIIPLLVILGCSTPPDKSQDDATESSALHDPSRSLPHPDWVDERVAKAKERLEGSEGGKLVWKSIQSHGGLKSWYNNGPLYFRFNYRPLGGGNRVRDSYQTVDTWSSVARHQLADESKTEFGWDGERAWKNPTDAELRINPRFWSLTPYFFVGLPFVLADEGVDLTQEENIEYEGSDHFIVRASYGENVGDASDYYVLYINAETYRLAAIRYVVSFKGFYPDGGHGAEKLMSYEGAQTISGVTFPKRHRTYKWSDEGQGEHVTDITVTDVAFKPGTLKSYFDAPEGSYIMKTYME